MSGSTSVCGFALFDLMMLHEAAARHRPTGAVVCAAAAAEYDTVHL